MPSSPVIKQITSLESLGVFRAYSAPAELPDLRKSNLIYGFNGCGKTILSRVLACLGTGALHPALPEGGVFEVQLTDGRIIKSTDAHQNLNERIFVFNGDFIEENLHWQDGTANSIFHLGKEQTQLAKEFETAEVERLTVATKLQNAYTLHEQKKKTFTEYKRGAARVIETELALGRGYVATHLSAAYAKSDYSETLKLTEAERTTQRSIITQDAPLPICTRLDTTAFDLTARIREIRGVLTKTLGSIGLKELREHEAMMKWVKEGSEYHQTHGVTSCLLCGNELTQERLRMLKGAIDDRFDKLTTDINTAKEKAQTLRDALEELKNAIPSENDIANEHRSSFVAAATDLEASIGEGRDIATLAVSLLAKKAETPNIRVEVGSLTTEEAAGKWDETTADRLLAVNDVIGAHNTSHDDFNDVQSAARKKLEEQLLADGQAHYRKLESDVTNAENVRDDLATKQAALANKVDKLRQSMREHGPAAEMINHMIHNYLGHKELEIAALENGYELRRHGTIATGSPSEGEQTAIALCYFLVMLEADGRKLGDLIVVLDDPISSLDTKALHYAFSILHARLSDAAQLIVMTHNLHFMNEWKKLLKRGTEKQMERSGKDKNNATSSLLFVDTVQSDEEDSRSLSIIEMPKHIREYESEYQYLFYLVLKFTKSDDGDKDHFFVMPNALRKVLEIFLAFKYPGSSGLSSKMQQLAKENRRIDENRVVALDRLVQLESHADNLDDLVTSSSMTIEETKDAADALLAIMQAVDKGHYDQMCKICQP